MTPEKEAAINFIKNCKQLYPEIDMMDDETRTEYETCWRILQERTKPVKMQSTSTAAPRKKKPGKLARYEEDVLECLHQGFGEEKQLLDEAYARKNPFARRNYIKAYYRALGRFQRGE